jgi:autotransporter-associated beta strand protein
MFRTRRKSCRHLQLEALEQRLAPATHTWTGAVSNLWSNPGNWKGGAPTPGETNLQLYFPPPADGLLGNSSNTNDIFGLTVQEIDFGYGGYTLAGKAIALLGSGIFWAGIQGGGTSTTDIISLDLNLLGDQKFFTDWTLDVQGVISVPTVQGSSGSSSPFVNLDFRGGGTLRFSNSANSYGGTTLVEGENNHGTFQVGANNAVRGAVTVNAGATFDLNGHSDAIDSLAGAGNVTLGQGGALTTGGNNASTTFSGIISGGSQTNPSKLIKTGTGTFILSGANTYSGNTLINGGVLELGANNAIPASSSVTLSAVTRLGLPPIVLESGSLDVHSFKDTIASLSSDFPDPVTLGLGTLTTGGDNSSTTFTGQISGGGLIKVGNGTFTLTGNNTLEGITVQAGTLLVNGEVNNVVLNGGTLGGVGTVGPLSANAGSTVQPGTANPGILHVTALTSSLASGATFQVRANSSTTYDQLVTGGQIALGSATGSPILNFLLNYAANIGDKFTIIEAGGGVSGTFNGLANGATFRAAGGLNFQIQYTATSVVLTRVAGQVTHFQIDTVSAIQAGVPFDYKVTALDAGNNVVTLFTGTVSFSSQDPYGASLPDNYTFTIGDGGDNGVHLFAGGATLYTAGTWDITATVLSTAASSSALVNVTPAPAVSFAILAPAISPAGASFDVTLAAQDPYGNIDTNYQGTVHFSTSDTDVGVLLPADYTFQESDQGVHTFDGGVTLLTVGDQTLIVIDTVNGMNGSATVTIGGATAPRDRRAGASGIHGQLVAAGTLAPIPAQILGSSSSGTKTTFAIPLEAAAVDSVFAVAGQVGHGLAAVRSVRHALAWVNDGPWEWLSTQRSVIL